MAKINITKPTGNVDNLNLLSAFKAENNIYIVFDAEKMGSMGLPIIYVSKYTTKLEKINDANEWQSVKNYLKGIISGTNFEYVKVENNLTADEAYYTPLTLPETSFNAIRSRYIIKEDNNSSASQTQVLMPKEEVTPVMPSTSPISNTTVNITPVQTNETTQTPSPDSQTESVLNLIDNAYNNDKAPNMAASINPTPAISKPNNDLTSSTTPEVVAKPETPNIQNDKESIYNMSFENDKETFLKACENMFDALISKYQKKLNELEEREKNLVTKEAQINAKLKDANEHLANAEAREKVANIAHDNAQKVMDLNNFMPVNPNSTNSN